MTIDLSRTLVQLYVTNLRLSPSAPIPRPEVQRIAPPNADVVDALFMRRFSFEIQSVTDRGDILAIESFVEDRNGHGRMPLTFTLRISRALRGRHRALRIRRMILWALMHELDECLSYADGTPVVDPHPEHRDYRTQGVHPAVRRMDREAERHERKAGVR